MNTGMRIVAGSLLLAVLFSSAGCRAQMSDARRDHVLSGDHGWIDLTLKSAPKSAGFDPKKSCSFGFSSDGEMQLNESADLEHAAGSLNPVGYRFVAPAAKSEVQLIVTGCVPKDVIAKLPLDLAKDHLARLVFDGSALVLVSSAPYEPTSLEWVRGEILKLHATNQSAGAAVSQLTVIAIASLALNLLALVLFVVTRRRSAPRKV